MQHLREAVASNQLQSYQLSLNTHDALAMLTADSDNGDPCDVAGERDEDDGDYPRRPKVCGLDLTGRVRHRYLETLISST